MSLSTFLLDLTSCISPQSFHTLRTCLTEALDCISVIQWVGPTENAVRLAPCLGTICELSFQGSKGGFHTPAEERTNADTRSRKAELVALSQKATPAPPRSTSTKPRSKRKFSLRERKKRVERTVVKRRIRSEAIEKRKSRSCMRFLSQVVVAAEGFKLTRDSA